MKQTQSQNHNQLMTTMSTSGFNISESSPSKISKKKKSRTPNLTPNRDLDKSRSMTYRSTSNFIDLSHSPSISTIKRTDTNLYERLYNQAKELKEKIDNKKNEFLQQLKKESIPKIHETSKKIERKQDLFPERLYPYHKLNKLDTDEDNSGSFEYAHVATVRSNPLGISGEFDNDDFRNNIDSIFCDDEEIKNLYGNKPSFVKIYRGIKHRKKEQFPFKPMLSKNSDRIVKNLESTYAKEITKKSRSNCFDDKTNLEEYGIASRRRSCQEFNINRKSLIKENESIVKVDLEKESTVNSAVAAQFISGNNSNNMRNTISAMPAFINSRFNNSNNNLIDIDFIYENECFTNNNAQADNNNRNFDNVNLDNIANRNYYNKNSNVNNPVNSHVNNNNSYNFNSNNSYLNNNNSVLVSAAYKRDNSANLADTGDNNKIIGNYKYNNNEKQGEMNCDLNNNNNNNYKDNNDGKKNKADSNNNNLNLIKKAAPNYFDNPTEKIKSRYEMELKKSYTSNYYNLNKQKAEKINPKSINISNKLYSQGINFMKKKEKITEEKRKADLEDYKNHSFKPNLNITSSTAFANTNNNTNNLNNYNTSNSSVNFASNNLSGFAKKNSNNENTPLKNNKIDNVNNVNNSNMNSNLIEAQSALIKAKVNINSNNSKSSAFTHATNKTASTNYTKNNPKSSNFYAKNLNSLNNKPSSRFNNNNSNFNNCNNNNNSNSKYVNKFSNNSNNNKNNNNFNENVKGRSNNFYASKPIRNFNHSCEENKTPNTIINNSVLNINSNINNTNNNFYNNINNSAIVQTPVKDNRSCSSLSRSVNSGFYDRSKKWKDNKEQKAEKQREEKTKEELGKCSFSPKIIPKRKNFFEEKFINKKDLNNNNNNISDFNNSFNMPNKSDYVTRMQNSYYKKTQEKNFQSKIFGENAKNLKMKITQPQEFNFSQLVSRKCRENFNKARILHRAESVKNYREKLSTNIFFNEAVFEIEENLDLTNSNVNNADATNKRANFANNSHLASLNNNGNNNNNFDNGKNHKSNNSIFTNNSDGNSGDGNASNSNRNISDASQQVLNKNMNINLNVNIMMNNK